MRKARILVVEDERIVAHDIKMGLQRLGYIVSGIAVSGEEAIKKTEEARPDLVLVDIVLEGNIDGIKAAEIIRSRFNIPIVYLTAYADKNKIERAKKTEPFGYIVKPFEDRELQSVIEIALYKHKLENMLRESEEKYRELADSISDIFSALDKDLRYTYWNKASEKLTGIKAKDALGKSISEIFPDNEETRRAKKAYQEVLHTKKPQTFISEYSLAGKQCFFEISAYPSKRGLSVFVKDITERKKTEEKLQASEAFNFALFQYNPVETIVVDHAGRVVKTNLARRRSGDRWPNIGDLMYKDYAGKHEINMHAELMECIRSGKKKDFPELKYGDKFLCITIAPFPMGAIITSQDITERKRAEEALKKAEQEIRLITNNVPAFLSYVDPDGCYRFVNKVYEELFGLPQNKIIGKHLRQVLGEDTYKKIKGYVNVALSGKRVDFEEELPYKYGGTRWMSESYIPEIDDEGNVAGFFALVSDITKRKKTEEELRKSHEQLRNLAAHLESIREQERTLIAREMHDELGQSLTALKMDLSWLGSRISKEQKSLLEKTKSMTKLVDKTFQSVKRISTELRPGLLDDIGLPAAIEWQAEEFENRTGIKCVVSVVPEDMILDSDCSTAIFRIFQETLTNIARHAHATRAGVRLIKRPSRIELQVKDNGKGITEEQIGNPKSFGLIGIQERTSFLGGVVKIRGVQGKGTTVIAKVPFSKKGVIR
jgi:PAS domain S-box-containing protein